MSDSVFLAVDIGASSGRHVAGLFDGNRLRLEEVYRFENGAVPAAGHLYWDLLQQWSHIRTGLRMAANKYGNRLASLGVDTWGVDYGLLDKRDELLGNPFTYRDHRADGMLERAFAIVPKEQIFQQTGVQFMQINTLYQLLSSRLSGSPILDAAETFLMMPDLFHWLLTGEKANEFTDASTSQCLDPLTQDWSKSLLEQLGIPTGILKNIVHPGTKLGKLRPQLAAEMGLSKIEVVLPGTHDTASAVMAVPATSTNRATPDWCYISSGTWSLMGVEIPQPILSRRCLELNFTNEGGVDNTIRLLKNISGLWLVQECRRIWNQTGKAQSWEDLSRAAAAAPPLAYLIDPDDAGFLSPDNMPQAIAEYCRRTGQGAPPDPGAVLRCALESLALAYRRVLGALEELTGGRINRIHIVGGGTQNRQLCQAAADACQRRVVAGPVEATAIGNLMMQAVAAGQVANIAQAREIIRHSFSVDEYAPRDKAAWDAAYDRFQKLAPS
ncbi:MAG TPA: rhamnulokinase family protein [Pirellulales bacterium]|nr:rhamnulokinase family protein [Pirellulales bacterium]